MDYKNIEEIKRNLNSLDSLAPYVGKMRPELVSWLINRYADRSGIIYDPFSGSGTVLLEGWRNGYCVIGSELNEYAIVLSNGKMNPYRTEQLAMDRLEGYKKNVKRWLARNKEISVPDWVKEFYHPETLREICAWVKILKHNKEWFLMSCLLGILHHQRPGFLSYPSSHGAPYLRINKYPESEYPEMYQYREVYSRLKAKVSRVYRNFPELDYDIKREVHKKDATKIKFTLGSIDTIITSPPYMKSLTYARDNRLRLWFLGVEDWKELDKKISPERNYFFKEMERCFKNWYKMQQSGGKCILVVGNLDTKFDGKKCTMPDVLIEISKPYYNLLDAYIDPIPEKRKVSFNEQIVNILVNDINPEKVFLINQGCQRDCWREAAIEQIHRNILDEYSHQKDIMTKFLLTEYDKVFEFLVGLYKRYWLTNRIIVSPTGYKMHAISFALMKICCPDIHVEYPTPDSYLFEGYSSDAVKCIYELKFERFEEYLTSIYEQYALGG